MLDLITFIMILGFTYFIGTTLIERRHYHSILEREKNFLLLPAVTTKNLLDDNREIADSRLVYANVVISIDYFKRFLAGLQNIFGGEVSSYETILDRARREAILRLKEASGQADIIINLRLQTSTIGKTRKQQESTGCSEVLAYGTAVTYKK